MHRVQSHAHHYVPEWYQRRFLPPRTNKYYYLDLQPETIVQHGHAHQRRAVRHLGPDSCFYKDDLYALNFGGRTTDEMEQFFFGAIDSLGCGAVAEFASFEGITDEVVESFRYFNAYMGAQRFRTPRGLLEMKKRFGWRQQLPTLVVLRSMFEAYATMWSEGVWEIVRARQSPTKFLVTDNPVTFYCKVMFSSEWTYPNDPRLEQIGTRTIFPLGLDSCLVVTHLQLVRNLWATPTEFRENARYFDQTMNTWEKSSSGGSSRKMRCCELTTSLNGVRLGTSPLLNENGYFLSATFRRQSGERSTKTGSCCRTFGRCRFTRGLSPAMIEVPRSQPTSMVATLGSADTKINDYTIANGRCTVDRGRNGQSGAFRQGKSYG